MSFNLSRLDFITCDIFTEIEKLTQAYQLPPSQLRIEITESVFIKDIETVNQTLNKFRAAGYQIWMDDFGSGYSSLNVLKDYEFDTIKLDMAFLSNFTDRSKEIVKSVVDMAKHLGIHILTEGVETLEQYTFLRNIGCEMLQGFLFSKPLPYIQAIEYIEELGLTHENAGNYLILLPESQGHHYLHIASSCRGADAKRVQRLIQVYKEYFEKK